MSDLDRNLILEAKRTSPLPIITRSCSGTKIIVARNGNIKAQKVLRSEQNNDGTWVTFDWYGQCLGDNISLIQKLIPNTHFFDAVEMLTGRKPLIDGDANFNKNRRRSAFGVNNDNDRLGLRIPNWTTDFSKGREWLIKRGISKLAIDYAEKEGGLKYTQDGVAYCGFDNDKRLKYIAVRYFNDMIDSNTGELFNKKDAIGSLKKYPFMLKPKNENESYNAFIVEGGTNALAILDFSLDKGNNSFIMTTGGVAIREWMNNKEVIDYLARANKVVLINENETAGELETADEKQVRLDKIRHNIILELNDKLEEVNGGVAEYIKYVPKRFEDASDWRKSYIENENTRPKRMDDEKDFVFSRESIPAKPIPTVQNKNYFMKKNEYS